MPQFELILPNEKKKLYNRFALLLFLLTGTAVIIKLFYSGQHPDKTLALFLSIAALLLLVYQAVILYANKVNRYLKAFITGSLALSLFWFYMGPWWIGLLSLVLTLLYLLAQRELKVEIRQEQVIYPSFPKQIIRWNELNNLVLKDGLLTIDFKNDKIIQQYPDLKTNPVDEQEFNEFCQQQLHQNPESRIQNPESGIRNKE